MHKSWGEERNLALALALALMGLAWLEQRGLGRDMQAEPGDSEETCRQSQGTRERHAGRARSHGTV